MRVLTIRALCAELKREGTPIPESALRALVKSGAIRSFSSGSRLYLTREWLDDFLRVQEAAPEAPAAPEQGVIRRVQ